MLEQSLDIALADGMQEHAARAWTNIGTHAGDQTHARRRRADLPCRVDLLRRADLDSWSLYMRAWLAGVQLERGSTDAAASAWRRRSCGTRSSRWSAGSRALRSPASPPFGAATRPWE